MDTTALRVVCAVEAPADLARERAAHERTRAEYESLIAAIGNACAYRHGIQILQCAHCGCWTGYRAGGPCPQTGTVVHFETDASGQRTCRREVLAWCRDCDDKTRCSPWANYDGWYGSLDHDGRDLAAALIQVAWRVHVHGELWD